MPSNTFILPFRPAFDSNGLPVPGAKLNFYLAGTLTRTAVYSDSLMTNELPNPVVANSAGRFAEIFLDEAVTYRVVLTDEDDVTLDDADPYTYGSYGTYVDLISAQTIGGTKEFTATATFAAIRSTSPTGGIGYGVGAGGSVTQATNRSTAVTLNKPTGTIITHNAALADGASVFFTFNNSNIAATDNVIVQVRDNAVITVRVYAFSAGSCVIHLTNNNGATANNALTLNFSIIKGVAS